MIEIYDSTLREGLQGVDIDFSDSDKLEIIKALDNYGIDFIELGWPGSGREQLEFIQKAASLKLRRSSLTVFGSTVRPGKKPEDDPNLRAIIDSGVKIACIFGKTWKDHIRLQLKISPDENLDLIRETIGFLRRKGLRVFYDAEHFFEGYKNDPEYALAALRSAADSGANTVILCDTNGGMLPWEVRDMTKSAVASGIKIGIHCHNDSGFALANTIAAIHSGAVHVQGTINGFGERAGNTDLCSCIPTIVLKLGKKTGQDLKETVKISHFIYTIANMPINPNQPYVGRNAFSHKGGVHVDAINKGASYEHIDPQSVGNRRNIILSNMSGKANIMEILKNFAISVDKDDPRIANMLAKVKELEHSGYDINDIDAEKFLLSREFFSERKRYFDIDEWRIHSEYRNGEFSECILIGSVDGRKREVIATVEGGPVEAIYESMKKMVGERYKRIREVSLVNFKVMIAKNNGAESTVRVYIKFSIDGMEWGTVGVSQNILKASIEAIQKGFNYFLLKTDPPTCS